MKSDESAILKKIRAICLAFPDAHETETWGKPHFRVNNKIFAGFGEEGDKLVVGFKLEMEHARQLIEIDDRFWKAPYVGHKGWVSMDARRIEDWSEFAELVEESFRLIAPTRSIKKLNESSSRSTNAAANSESGLARRSATRAGSASSRKKARRKQAAPSADAATPRVKKKKK